MQAPPNTNAIILSLTMWQKLCSAACLVGLLAGSFPLTALAQTGSLKPLPGKPSSIGQNGYTGPNQRLAQS